MRAGESWAGRSEWSRRQLIAGAVIEIILPHRSKSGCGPGLSSDSPIPCPHATPLTVGQMDEAVSKLLRDKHAPARGNRKSSSR